MTPKRPVSIRIVLVRSLYETNIGATSRAMANMGCDRLILIDKKCDLGLAAQKSAATGQTALQNRIEYENWESFFRSEAEGIRIALTARDGRGRAVTNLATQLRWLESEAPSLQESSDEALPIYLIFGPEDWGLSAEDLELAHFACSIPTFGTNTSLNLAQAVLLATFIFRDVLGGQRAILEGQDRSPRSDASYIFPEQTLKIWLTKMGFDLSKPKTNAFSVLRRMLLHNVPTAKELVILETVLQQSIRKLDEYNELRTKNVEYKKPSPNFESHK